MMDEEEYIKNGYSPKDLDYISASRYYKKKNRRAYTLLRFVVQFVYYKFTYPLKFTH